MFLLSHLASIALLTALTLTSRVHGRITKVSVPETALVGSTIEAVLCSEQYIQNWDDFGAVWGLVRPGQNITGGVGIEIGYQNLYGNANFTDARGNSTFPVQLPTVAAGTYTFVAAIPHLVGASGETSVNFFNQTINLVDNVKRRRV